MPLEIVRNDITVMHVDAIVNPTNPMMFGTAGVDGKIHNIEGPELKKRTSELGICEVGETKLTKAYKLPSKHIIHTVGPVWKDGYHNEDKLLESCYRSALNLAIDNAFESIAFPLISSGTFGYPKDRALSTAIATIGEFLLRHDLLVYLVVYDKNAFQLSEKLFSRIETYIDDHYVDSNPFTRNSDDVATSLGRFDEIEKMQVCMAAEAERSLDDLVNNIDLTFSEMLLKLIDDRNLKDSDVYKKANVDRKLFSKIRNNKAYKTSKQTALAFAIALELNLDETRDLLLKAGFALSNSHRFDIIIKYFIEDEIYDIFKINEALFAFDQNTLGV